MKISLKISLLTENALNYLKVLSIILQVISWLSSKFEWISFEIYYTNLWFEGQNLLLDNFQLYNLDFPQSFDIMIEVDHDLNNMLFLLGTREGFTPSIS